jgi:hypothetical protein
MLGRSALLAAAVLALALPAAAQEHPQYRPTRDVAVEYSIEGRTHNGGPKSIKAAYMASGDRLRVEAGHAGYWIIDRPKGRMFMIIAAQKTYMELPFNPGKERDFMLSDKMKFTRAGSDTVAGLPCTIWQIQADKHSGTACITADGVMLRGETQLQPGNSVKIVAASVDYGPQPEGMFAPPADYNRLQMPRLPPGMAPGGMHPPR